MALVTANVAVVLHRLLHVALSGILPVVLHRLLRVALSGTLPVVGATTAGHHLRRRVLVAGAMTVAHHHHLAPEGTTGVAVMAEIVGVVSRIRGRPLVGTTTARVSVRPRPRRGRACETAIEIAITSAEETTRGTDTGIVGVERDGLLSTTCLCALTYVLVRYAFMCASVKKRIAILSSTFCSLTLQNNVMICVYI